MIPALISRVSMLRQRALAIFHRSDALKAESAERRARWNTAITEHKQGQQPKATPAPAAKE